MPRLNGIEATRRITSEMPACRVIALSAFAEKRQVDEVLRAGAVRYMTKDVGIRDVSEAIASVLANERLPRSFNTHRKTDPSPCERVSRIDSLSKLTRREKEILGLLGEGKTSADIAKTLFISVRTVECHRLHLMAKLEIHCVAGLVAYAGRRGKGK